jgi:CsoR family transcriptional regulator, copper-sensing transcriptional repressor
MATGRTKHPAEGGCACEIPASGRKALGVDPEIKVANLRRLSRIEGQVRGIQRMVEENRYCADILMQVTSAQEALRAVARSLMRNHLSHCASHAIQTGTREEREAMYDELLEMIYKNAR